MARVAVGRGGVRRVRLGPGRLVVCVPVVATDRQELRAQWKDAAYAGADLIEWRVDAQFDGKDDEEFTARALEEGRALHEEFQIPLLLTVRTVPEGGAYVAVGKGYGELVRTGAEFADLIDIEWANASRRALVDDAHRAGAAVVGSAHFFDRSLDSDYLRELLTDMEAFGADVAKVAWSVRSDGELQELLRCQEWAEHELSVPAVVIGMGQIGSPSRVGSAARRNAFTFASVGKTSAPGQLSLEQVRAADR